MFRSPLAPLLDHAALQKYQVGNVPDKYCDFNRRPRMGPQFTHDSFFFSTSTSRHRSFVPCGHLLEEVERSEQHRISGFRTGRTLHFPARPHRGPSSRIIECLATR